MKRFFKRFFIAVAIFLIVLIGVGYFMHEPLPEGKVGLEAERLTDKVEKAINKSAWDSTVAVSWTFAGTHSYVWDKKRDLVQLIWKDNKVIFNTRTLKGVAYENEIKLFGDQEEKMIQKGWENFANDSFWLIAPFKLRDTGTERSIVVLDGDTCLKVTYTSGGVTPGDSYVWLLEEDGTPKAWKLWVKIIPVGGIEYGWNEWITTTTGARISTLHKGLYDIHMTNIRTGMSIKEVYDGRDNPFDVLSF